MYGYYFSKVSNQYKLNKVIIAAGMSLLWQIGSLVVDYISVIVIQGIITKVVPQLCYFSINVATFDSLSHAVGSMYAQVFFKEDAKSAADSMVVFIRAEFEKILKTLDWMDPMTRKRALAKAKAITPHIAYPPELLMEHKLAELYDGVSKHLGY